MGRALDSIIVTMYELQTQAGKTIIVPFIGRLTGSGVSGSQVLEGNEEDLGSGNMPISIDWRRNADQGPKQEVGEADVARPGGVIHQRERRDRHQADHRHRENALALHPFANAVEAWAEHVRNVDRLRRLALRMSTGVFHEKACSCICRRRSRAVRRFRRERR